MPLALLPSRRIGRVTYKARKQTQAHGEGGQECLFCGELARTFKPLAKCNASGDTTWVA
jgi:hypothetical protein